MTLINELKKFEARVKAFKAEGRRHKKVAARLEREYQEMVASFEK